MSGGGGAEGKGKVEGEGWDRVVGQWMFGWIWGSGQGGGGSSCGLGQGWTGPYGRQGLSRNVGSIHVRL